MVQDIEEKEEGSISPIIFLPTDTTYPVWKIVVGGRDVTGSVDSSQLTLVATDRLNNANIDLINKNGRFNDKWNPEEKRIPVKIYFDYGDKTNFTTLIPTTQIYEGVLDKNPRSLSIEGYMMNLSSRTAPELNDMNITTHFDSNLIHDAIKSVIAQVNNELGYTVITEGTIEETTRKTSVSYRSEKPINILSDLLKRAGFSGRINVDLTYDAFTKGTQLNEDESIKSGTNVYSTSPIGSDSTRIKNRIRGYGPDKEGCLILETKSSAGLKPWRKDQSINDTIIQNRDELIDRLDKELENQQDSEIQGTITSSGLITLLPGQSIQIFIQYTYDGTPIAEQITHKFSMNGVETITRFNEIERDGWQIIKDNERDIRQRSTYENPNDMSHGYHFTFDNEDQVFSHSGTEIVNGKLRLISGSDQGTMTSNILDVDDTINFEEVRINGNDIDISFYDVSANGVNFENNVSFGNNGEPGPIININNPGKKMQLKITLKSDANNLNPELESCVLLGKT